MSHHDLPQLDLARIDLSWLYLSWLFWSWLDLSWIDLSWLDLSWLHLSYLDQSWIALSWLATPHIIRTSHRYPPDTFQKPLRNPPDNHQTPPDIHQTISKHPPDIIQTPSTGCSLGTVKITMLMREPWNTKWELGLVFSFHWDSAILRSRFEKIP